MKAAVLHKPNTPVRIEELEIETPREGEVLLNIVGAGVCHSDHHFVDGHVTMRKAPWVPGHGGAGT